MQPTHSFQDELKKTYAGERVEVILRQLMEAQESVGFATLLGEITNESYQPGLYLVIHDLQLPIHAHKLTVGEHVIGRWPRSNIVLSSAFVSRTHCVLTVHAEGRVVLRDLKSSNGTSVNGQRLAADDSRVLQNNDQITMPGVLLMLVQQPPVDQN